jgi:hypothetical protein
MRRRNFIATTGAAAAGTILTSPAGAVTASENGSKKRLVLVGTGDRGSGFWGSRVNRNYGDIVEICQKDYGS